MKSTRTRALNLRRKKGLMRTLTRSMGPFAVLILLTLSLSEGALARSGWSWGVGYHNPPNATLGLNFMHLWSNWAFELGLGYINSTESDEAEKASPVGDVRFSMAGDVNLKYLFGSGSFRPYLQGGTYFGFGAQTGDQSGVNASAGGAFAGLGIFILGQSIDFYIGLVTARNGSLQFGFNF